MVALGIYWSSDLWFFTIFFESVTSYETYLFAFKFLNLYLNSYAMLLVSTNFQMVTGSVTYRVRSP